MDTYYTCAVTNLYTYCILQVGPVGMVPKSNVYFSTLESYWIKGMFINVLETPIEYSIYPSSKYNGRG